MVKRVQAAKQRRSPKPAPADSGRSTSARKPPVSGRTHTAGVKAKATPKAPLTLPPRQSPSKPQARPQPAKSAIKADKKKPAKAKKRTVKLAAAASSRKEASASLLPTAQQARVLLNLEGILARRIMGKDDAIARIARVVRVRMTHLDFRPDRPNGSFLLVGPTGAGKNELAYALSEALLGSEERVIAIDLGELAEEGDLAKLAVTLVPGSETQAMEGMLTSPVRRDPEAVILLRGLERAHASFQPVLQQILERGRLEDMLGPVSFSRNVIFVTTHPKKDEAPALAIGFGRTAPSPEDALRKRLERNFSGELLDSFNEVIEIPPLTPEAVRSIARYKVETVLRRLQKRRREIQVADNVFEAFLPNQGADREGMALLHRTLEDHLFNPLARYLLEHPRNRTIRVEMIEGSLSIHE